MLAAVAPLERQRADVERADVTVETTERRDRRARCDDFGQLGDECVDGDRLLGQVLPRRRRQLRLCLRRINPVERRQLCRPLVR